MRIRDVPDFPKPGVIFKDIMPLLGDAEALADAVDRIAEWAAPREPDLVLGAEARGYITGGALACKLGCGFVPARKPGKLPWHTVAAKYALEYGFDQLEVHADAIKFIIELSFLNGREKLADYDVFSLIQYDT